MKKKILVLCLAIALISVLATGTFAYYTKSIETKNNITAGTLSFEIKQINGEGKDASGELLSILPGDKVERTVTAVNNGTNPIYLRVKLTKKVKDSELPADDQIIIKTNEDDWTLKADGYYYYKYILYPEDETEPLFTNIEFDGPSVTNDYILKELLVDVDGEAVQSENNGTNVWTAEGWETVGGDK